MANFLAFPKFRLTNTDGTPLVGGKVNVYEPGTTTRKTTYSDTALQSANTNPVILDARGEAWIFYTGKAKLAWTDASDVEIDEKDNIQLSGDEAPEWVNELTATHVDADTFTVTDDQTTNYHVGRRVKLVGDTMGTVYGKITASSFSSSTTTVDVLLDSGSIDNTLTTSFTGLPSFTNPSVPVLDEDNMASDSALIPPSQQSTKAYVDAQVTAQDLDFQADTGGALSIDLDSEAMTFTGGTGIDTSGSSNTVTVAIDNTVVTLTGAQAISDKTSIAVDNLLFDGNTISSTNAGGDVIIDANSGADIRFDIGSAEQGRIRSGNLGIGTGANIDQIIHAEKSTGTTIIKAEVGANSLVGFELQRSGGTTAQWRIVDGSTANGILSIRDESGSHNFIDIESGANGNINFIPNGTGGTTLVSSAATTDAFTITANSLTTGTALRILSNNGNATHSGNLVEIINDFNAGGSADLLYLQQDDDGDGINISMARGGTGLVIDGVGSGLSAVFNHGDVVIGDTSASFTTGSGLEIQRAGPATLRLEDTGSGGKVFELSIDDATGVTLNSASSGMPLIFNVLNAEALRIGTDGNLLASGDSVQMAFQDAGSVTGAEIGLLSGGQGFLDLKDAAGSTQIILRADTNSISIGGVAVPTISSTDTLSNKTIALGSNTVSGTTAQFNTALTDGDFATLAGSETLTNKTLTSPVINTGIELGHATDTTITRSSAGRIAVEGNNLAVDSIGFSFSCLQIELGHASDTTISRSGPGRVQIEGQEVARGTPTDGNFLVGNGTIFTEESGDTARNSLGLGTGDNPQFNSIELGHASDTSITRPSAGTIAVEGVDVLTTSNTKTVTNKTIDTTSNTLTVNYDDLQNHRGCLVYLDANQSTSTGGSATINFDQEDYDTDSIHDNSTNNERLTVPSGVTKVRLTARISWSSNSTGYRQATILENGVNMLAEPSVTTNAVNGTDTEILLVSAVVRVVANDYFTLTAFQNSGGNLDVRGFTDGRRTWFAMEILE